MLEEGKQEGKRMEEPFIYEAKEQTLIIHLPKEQEFEI